jgi:hypothetical protein
LLGNDGLKGREGARSKKTGRRVGREWEGRRKRKDGKKSGAKSRICRCSDGYIDKHIHRVDTDTDTDTDSYEEW